MRCEKQRYDRTRCINTTISRMTTAHRGESSGKKISRNKSVFLPRIHAYTRSRDRVPSDHVPVACHSTGRGRYVYRLASLMRLFGNTVMRCQSRRPGKSGNPLDIPCLRYRSGVGHGGPSLLGGYNEKEKYRLRGEGARKKSVAGDSKRAAGKCHGSPRLHRCKMRNA